MITLYPIAPPPPFLRWLYVCAMTTSMPELYHPSVRLIFPAPPPPGSSLRLILATGQWIDLLSTLQAGSCRVGAFLFRP